VLVENAAQYKEGQKAVEQGGRSVINRYQPGDYKIKQLSPYQY